MDIYTLYRLYLPPPGVRRSIVSSYDPLIVHMMVKGCLSNNQPFDAHMHMRRE